MIKVYKNNENDYVCELWEASTKHPDSIFFMKDFKTVDFIEKEHQVFQWLLECASKLTFPFHAKELAEYAFNNWITWEDREKQEV